MPVHRIDEYFDISLQSIFDNFPPKCELIIILNGPALESNLFENFDERVRIIRSFERGIVPALNCGLRIATGKYLARIDHDDLVLNNRFVEQKKFLDLNSNVGIVGTDVVEVCPHGILGRRWGVSLNVGKLPWKPVFPRLAHPSVMFRRELLESVGFYRNVFDGVEDHDFWTRALDQTCIKNLKLTGVGYRIHQNQTSSIINRLNSLKIYLYNELGFENINYLKIFELSEAKSKKDFIKLITSIKLRLDAKIKFFLAVNYWFFLNELSSRTDRNLIWVLRFWYFIPLYVLQNRRSLILGKRKSQFNCLFCQNVAEQN